MKEKLRDKTRDNLTNALNSLGVKAEMAERERAEEKVHNGWWNRSLGVIDLPEGPVRWINVIKKDQSKESPPMWWINHCIPDERPISGNREIDVKTVRKKSFPLLGKVIGVDWKGKDHSTGLVNRLSYDQATKDLATRIGNIRIRSYSKEFQGWTCAGGQEVRAYPPGLADHPEDRRLPSVGSPRLTVSTTNVPEVAEA